MTRSKRCPIAPSAGSRNYVTTRGLQQIESAVAELQSALANAVAHDDPPAARKIVRDLNYWKARRASAELVSPPLDGSTVRFGSKVTLDTWRTPPELPHCRLGQVDPKQGFISYVAPLARELIGKELGETVSTPGGEAEIIAIEIGD